MSKYHLTNINMKESSNADRVVNKKILEISNELGQSLLGVHISPNFVNMNLLQEDPKELVTK